MDYVDSSGVGGWVWKSSAPNLPIEAHVYVYDSNGTQVYGVPVTANQYRSDLVNAGMGNGYHGFSTSIPWDYLPQGELKVVAYAVDGSGSNVQIYNMQRENPYRPDYSYTTMGHYLSKLTDAVNHYKSITGKETSALEFALQYIRRGVYNDSRWVQAADPVSNEMISYINSTSTYKDLQYYFTNDPIVLTDSFTGAQIDATHMFATLHVLVHDTVPGEASWLPATFGEPIIDDLGGWAGDLETFQQDVIDRSSNPNDFQANYNIAIAFLRQDTGSRFSMPDLYADADALNINTDLNQFNNSLSDAFLNYYGAKAKKRYTSFTEKRFGSNREDIVIGAMDYVMPTSLIAQYSPLMKDCHPTSNQANAVIQAFADRCWELKSYE
ncbi:hypothetical protein [Ethanoligenens harbinense]|uniref:hypothetical protein n=1 Tax=Ethanoligenens harbinense TaxID=253239 RepID=UPI0010C02D86|nr:hypothetical protein [Ethanoligenens harbinense]